MEYSTNGRDDEQRSISEDGRINGLCGADSRFPRESRKRESVSEMSSLVVDKSRLAIS